MDPFVFGVGADLSVLLGNKDDCWQVTVEGLSVSRHQFLWQYFLVILQAAGGWRVHRLRNSGLAVRSGSGEEESEEQEGSCGDCHPLRGGRSPREGAEQRGPPGAGRPLSDLQAVWTLTT